MSKFRANYYEKVGCLDEKKPLEGLLSEDPVNLAKLSNFAAKSSSVPQALRLSLWKLILDISSKSPKNRDYVWSWRKKSRYHK